MSPASRRGPRVGVHTGSSKGLPAPAGGNRVAQLPGPDPNTPTPGREACGAPHPGPASGLRLAPPISGRRGTSAQASRWPRPCAWLLAPGAWCRTPGYWGIIASAPRPGKVWAWPALRFPLDSGKMTASRAPCATRGFRPEKRLSWRLVGFLLVAPVLLLCLNSGKSWRGCALWR